MAALSSGGVTFLLLWPTEKAIAKELDSEYGLNEKVQTALAFRDAEGEVVDMLKSDTEKRLLNLPKRKFDATKIWQYVLIAAMSLAVFVPSLFAPARTALATSIPQNPTENPTAQYVFTEEQMADLQELIDNVSITPLDDGVKAGAVDALKKLKNNLPFAETNGDMIGFVNVALKSVNGAIKDPLSYRSIANALGAVAQNDLAKMIADGVQVYKNRIIVGYADVVAFYAERVQAVTQVTEKGLTAFFDALAEGKEAGDDEVGFVEKTYGDIYTALNLSDADDADELRTVLYDFAKALAQNDNTLTNDAALTFDINFNAALAEQAYRLAMNKYVTNRLREIFGLPVPADESFVPNYSQSSDPSDGTDSDLQGGYGRGDMLYGSDDEVYDPVTGEYVKYGDIFNDYYAIIESLLRDGTLTEEQQAVVRAYLEILLSGIKDKE
ncbi:MAG: hypothetical protein J1G38_04095 [Clostridiales bacterium]|nr:hypothetical protein [Clostridiales bacterium]